MTITQVTGKTVPHSERFWTDSLNTLKGFILSSNVVTNDPTERMIHSVQNKPKAKNNKNVTFVEKLSEIIYKMRSTPLNNGCTPIENYFNQNMLIKSSMYWSNSQNLQLGSWKFSCITLFMRGKAVVTTEFVKIIIRTLAKLHYEIKLNNGHNLKTLETFEDRCDLQRSSKVSKGLFWRPSN